MKVAGAVSFVLLAGTLCFGEEAVKPSIPSIDYDLARSHEIKPHRRTVPMSGVSEGFNQLHITVTVSPAGGVIDARAESGDDTLKFWPRIEPEVRMWGFIPFEVDGKAVTAEVEEYVDLVPPERLPATHVTPPILRSDSKIAISLERTGCYGTCPSYEVSVGTDGIEFNGRHFVVAEGRHRDRIDPERVRGLAKRFIDADFYSMDACYRAGVTDNPTYVLSATIDGRVKRVQDYVGSWVGMPAVIADLEDEVDGLAGTARWIEGTDGLVQALAAEGFDFRTPQAQSILKRASDRGQAATVQQLLKAGVSLDPMAPPTLDDLPLSNWADRAGWLTAASGQPKTLKVLLDAGASKTDLSDKNLALAGAARSGNLESVRALIAYGADPNADLDATRAARGQATVANEMNGPGSILIDAAGSGNPDVVREILRYHPNLEARGFRQRTAIFEAGEDSFGKSSKDRAECVRLLVEAGANVNARDYDGNTPLHEIYLADVEVELLKLGADVNARNKEGETPIFTNVDDDSVALFIAHGADLTIRNKKGRTVVQAAKKQGPARQEALQKALRQARKQ
ncbi:MAG: DUF6438 domain-containing protein [Terracidiphilus sp.]